MSKTKSIVILTILAILIAVFGTACFASFSIPGSVYDYKSVFSTISKGIDLEGGYYAVLTPMVEEEDQDDFDLNEVITTLRKRLDDKGFTEATITIQDGDSLRVEIPNVESADEVLNIIGSQGVLTFQDSSGTVHLTGDDIQDANVMYDGQTGEPIVSLEFTTTGQKKFASVTEQLSALEGDENLLYIKLGDDVISSPSVSEKIDAPSAVIEGIETVEEAESIAAVISSGALSIQFQIGAANQISSTLGDNVLNNAMMAAGIGLLIIFAIMIFFYFGMGIASSLALMIYVILYTGLLAIVPGIQLTLPGIAGIILSIGMAVDANVIIFDRIKEEFASGKTLYAAIEVGFKRALVTVLDSNITTIISSVILYLLGSGSIKGFAVTLLIGILLSMFTAVVITRTLLRVVMPLSKNHEAFFALTREEEANV